MESAGPTSIDADSDGIASRHTSKGAVKVNFNIRNHGPVHIQDFVDYIAAGVGDLGLPFVISNDMKPDAINVMLENFEAPGVLEHVEQICRRYPDMPFVIVASEVLQDNVFNSAGWRDDMHDVSVYSRAAAWSQRTVNFHRIAPLAHAILCPSELLYASYVEHRVSDRLHYLPFVHLDGFASNGPDQPVGSVVEEDIDFLFTGVLTSHRKDVLGALERQGFVVATLPVSAPEYIRHHFMRRAKVYLALKHFDDTRTLSKMRVYWALSHGYFCMVEAGTDPTDLDGHLRWFTAIDQLADVVALDGPTRRALANHQRQHLRASAPGNPFAVPFAPWLRDLGHGATSDPGPEADVADRAPSSA